MASFISLLTLAMLGASYADKEFMPPPLPPTPGYSYGAPELRVSTPEEQEEDALASLALNIPGGGVAGEDYPVLGRVPATGFSCQDEQFPGYYADTSDEARCQVFHICHLDGRLDSFLCPNGTLFSQQYFVCQWWYQVECQDSQQFKSLNEQIGMVPEDSLRSEVLQPNQLYGAPEIREASEPLEMTTTEDIPELYVVPIRF